MGSRLKKLVIWAVVIGSSTSLLADEPPRVIALPLGGLSETQTGNQHFGVYVPTRFGGELRITSTDGKILDRKTPSNSSWTDGQEIGTDHQGWYTFRIEGAKKPYTIETKFVQVAQSLKRPWNFYYWPTKADSIHEPWAGGNGRVDTYTVNGDDQLIAAPGSYIPPGVDIVLAGPNGLLETLPAPGDGATWFPNLYDDLTWLGPDPANNNTVTRFATQSPLLKYDQIFGTSARQWEAAYSQNNDISRWPGHCLGGAVASILLNEPTPAPRSGMTKDELKSLWAELGENHLNHRIGDYANDIPAGPPRPGPDPCDFKVPRVHAMLETHIRGACKPILSNMRAFPPRGTMNEVWNHGLYKYIAVYHSMPGNDPRAVKIDLELHANSGSMLNGQEDTDRVVNYTYSLVYGLDGKVDETNLYAADWISVGGEAQFAPLNVMEIVESRWGGHNPQVTEANVRSIDLANGGTTLGGRMTVTAPSFRPAAEYEAGRPPMMAARSANQNQQRPTARQGGLFRGLFGGGR